MTSASFLITANRLLKTRLIYVLFSKMHYQAFYCCYFVTNWKGKVYSAECRKQNFEKAHFAKFTLRKFLAE